MHLDVMRRYVFQVDSNLCGFTGLSVPFEDYSIISTPFYKTDFN